MNIDFHENIVNQFLWRFIANQKDNYIIFANHDHTYRWYPQGYRLPVYLNDNVSDDLIHSIKIQLTLLVILMTGLDYSKITIDCYKINSYNAESDLLNTNSSLVH